MKIAKTCYSSDCLLFFLSYANSASASNFTNLGVLPGGDRSYAYGVSGDGLITVGVSGSTDSDRAFRYTSSDLMASLGILTGGSYSSATAISSDGLVVVGYGDDTSGFNRAFKYTVSDGMVALGILDGGNSSEARAVSADGSVIVGVSESADGNRAFKYTSSGGMVSLGTLDGGDESSAYGVSSDGSVIVGIANDSTGEDYAFIYNNASTSSSLVNLENTYASLYYNGSQLNSLINLKSSLLRSTLNQDCNKFGTNNLCVGLGARYGNVNKYNAREEASNLRLAYRLTPQLKAGIILDQAFSSQDPANFSVKNSQPMIGGFVDLTQNKDGSGLNLRLSGAYHDSKITSKRNALKNTEAGSGSSNLKSSGLLAELSYAKNLSKQLVLKPLLGLRQTQIQRDGYTEDKNISFPISYGSVKQQLTTAILGIKSTYSLRKNLGLNLAIGRERNLKSKMNGYTGTISQVGSFSLSAPSLKRNTAFIDGGIYCDLKENQRLSANVIYSSQTLNSANSVMVYASYLVGF